MASKSIFSVSSSKKFITYVLVFLRYDPNENLIPPVETSTGKYSVRTYLGRNANTALKINSPSLDAAGFYTVKVYTPDHVKEEKFQLTVKAKSKVQVGRNTFFVQVDQIMYDPFCRRLWFSRCLTMSVFTLTVTSIH